VQSDGIAIGDIESWLMITDHTFPGVVNVGCSIMRVEGQKNWVLTHSDSDSMNLFCETLEQV
jgi:hypothetical protein